MNLAISWGEPSGQGLTQLWELLAALLLSSMIGVEREIKQKSAGLRTHALVGLGSALFILISKYGFTDVLSAGTVVLDPSRVAAQIVSGIGFIGGGLIFVRRDVVRGLTTAAVVWVTAAVGAACGAGLPILAAVVTAAHFLVVYGYPPLVRRLSKSGPASSVLRLSYRDGRGVLREIMTASTKLGYSVAEVETHRRDRDEEHDDEDLAKLPIDLRLRVTGRPAITDLVEQLSELDGVLSVATGEAEETNE
ncbi:MAG TPA: MgtC/SapB family protein [Pseudonocardiaceae bacterium]|jgi:putative Mg2+ transporter-C (MgtC) family protein|nr:MgtC/SapB family protein [Pseudonocardiaceae bacterium]